MHPDKNLGDLEATAKFQRIRRAYETLSDPIKRKMYDVSRARGAYEPSKPPPQPEERPCEGDRFEPGNRSYTEKGFKHKASNMNNGKQRNKPGGVRTAQAQKPAPGAARYTPDGMPVGMEEESRPERAAEEFRRWERMRALGPPPAPKEDYWWCEDVNWAEQV